jgi:hypothetical protein
MREDGDQPGCSEKVAVVKCDVTFFTVASGWE